MPHDTSDIRRQIFEMRLGSTVNIVLKPQMIDTAQELRDYPVSERKCYFRNEHRLKYFQEYTPNNCELECEVDLILEKCGCLLISVESKKHFSYDFLKANYAFFFSKERKGIDICGFGSRPNCFWIIQLDLVQRNHEPCNCLPSCTTITYDADVYVAPLNMTDPSKFENELN
jgi:acid-sensing ion channel, other